MSNLPSEILTNIFLQLPTKSLGQCSCVCKTWCSLISNPEFAKLHLDSAIFSKSKLGLFLVPCCSPMPLEPCFIFENVDVNRAATLPNHNELVVDVELPQIDFEIVGSCNGLICLLYFPNRFVLWNPTIKDSIEIPHSPNSIDDDVMLLYGFGHDSSVDDYKLVRIVRSKSTTKLEIYSLRANSWKSIEHDPGSINMDIETKNGIFLNGSLHWVASRGMNRSGRYKRYDVIIVFIIEKMNFNYWEIKAPRCDACYHLTLGILRGCLSLFSYEEVEVIMVWVLKDYGAIESWSRLKNLPLNEFFYSNYVTPVCYPIGDELIVDVDGYHLMRYNVKDYTQLLLKICHKDWFSCVVYVESLISPNRYSIML